ncbi:MAG: type IV-A pilus assembly ATPase PilB [Gammaproteobacteria bacterium]|nr:type IV-A pilus assembly ATPase PilB [Gammaproteobacteria bacterium]
MSTPAGHNPAVSGLLRDLIAEGMLTPEVAQKAFRDAVHEGVPPLVHAVRQKLVSEKVVAQLAAATMGLPLIDVRACDLESQELPRVDADILERHRVIPLMRRGSRLFLAAFDPTDTTPLDAIRFQTGLTVETVVAELSALDEVLTRFLEQRNAKLLDTDDLTEDNAEKPFGSDSQKEHVDDENLVVKIVATILNDAVARGASDVHIEPYAKQYRVRMRVDGVLHQSRNLSLDLRESVAQRIKIMGHCDLSDRRKPTDGSFTYKLGRGRYVDMRVNTVPTVHGEKIVLRLIDPTVAQMGIDSLGYEEFQKDLYLKALARTQGMVLVTGPTGSGKTVSMYAAINHLNDGHHNICTVEDPVEIEVAGVNQVNVNPSVQLTFANALRAFLRQDPDVILVGEIRDPETAEVAVKAAQTGHLVLSTLHTNDAPQTITRLVDLGIPPYSLASALRLIIAQRLARRLCTHCREPLKLPPDVLKAEGFEDAMLTGATIFRAQGCTRCKDGYSGRVGLYQVLPISEAMVHLILHGANAPELAAQAHKEGVWDLRRAGLEKVRRGITTIEEINRVIAF